MKSFLTAFFTFAVFIGFSATVNAQQAVVGKVDVKIEVDTQKTPDIQAGQVKAKKVSSPRDWLEIEVEFEIDARPNDAVIPQVMMKYYVAIQAKDGSLKMLTGQVDHVNVVAGEETFSCAYVSPSSLGKITGDFKQFQASAVNSVAVAVFVNGELKGGESEGKLNGRWWEGQSGSQEVLPKAKTPFALLWLDRYADTAASSN